MPEATPPDADAMHERSQRAAPSRGWRHRRTSERGGARNRAAPKARQVLAARRAGESAPCPRAANNPPARNAQRVTRAVHDQTATRRMSPSRPFIERPVATSLLMLAIVLAGLVGFRFLPLSALPQVDYPTIQVQTLYPGASPDVMVHTVTAPLEGQFGQMSGLDRMSSTSAAGVSVITLQFSLNVTLDVAEQEVQAAINATGSLLPADLPAPPVYAKVNPADAPVLTLAVSSDSLPLPDVQNLVNTRLAQKISQVSGVGPRVAVGRPAAGDPHPGEHAGARVVWHRPRHVANGDQQRELERGEGQLRRPAAQLHNQFERPVAHGRRLPAADRHVQERRAGARGGRRQRHRQRREQSARRLGRPALRREPDKAALPDGVQGAPTAAAC